ncbi:hypothetical protein SAMN05444746_1406 [Variovorax sp. OK212]|nr:hypothetical protein SAMN05518853_1426 [Variovorax sp. OK202]SFE78838.1 hypothetical protein SAMN05444746_1406 [Variovorax sp. OK212]
MPPVATIAVDRSIDGYHSHAVAFDKNFGEIQYLLPKLVAASTMLGEDDRGRLTGRAIEE